MKLLTYRLDTQESATSKQIFLRALYQFVLKKDKYWHFFLDPDGGTLRFQHKYESRVKIFLKTVSKGYNIKYDKRRIYQPKKDEYYGVAFVGDNLLPLFHDMSVLTLEYAPYITIKTIIERLNHGLVNMAGIHDFHIESQIYLGLASGRLSLINMKLPLVKWIYKLYYKLIEKLGGKH